MMQINITKSWRKSISMRFDAKGILQVRAPKFMLGYQIDHFIEKNKKWINLNYKKILEKKKHKKSYLFGEKIAFCNDIGFYKNQAHTYIKSRCEELAGMYGFQYTSIRITSAKTRWGSCSNKKTLNFSYRLVMAPKEAIDYVIIHELCHLREMNHSSRFWKEVSNIMPDYKKHEIHLKHQGWKYCI